MGLSNLVTVGKFIHFRIRRFGTVGIESLLVHHYRQLGRNRLNKEIRWATRYGLFIFA